MISKLVLEEGSGINESSSGKTSLAASVGGIGKRGRFKAEKPAWRLSEIWAKPWESWHEDRRGKKR